MAPRPRRPLLAALSALALLGPWAQAAAESKPAPAPASPAPAAGHAKPEESAATKTERSYDYVHRWLPMPGFVALNLSEQEHQSIAARPGRALVVVFLASWCEPCQQVMPEIQRLEQRYRRLPADFVYVFAHDTREDATGFMKEYGMASAYLANHDVLKAYHNPELPSVYVGDRRGWLTTRYIKPTGQDVAKLDGFLKPMTSY